MQEEMVHHTKTQNIHQLADRFIPLFIYFLPPNSLFNSMNNKFGLFHILYMGYDLGPTRDICTFQYMLNLSSMTFSFIWAV